MSANVTSLPSAQRIGYARVSTSKQSLERQHVALEAAGCARIFEDKTSGAQRGADRKGFAEALAYLRPGDELTVLSLDRLARSLSELLKIVDGLKERGVGLQVLDMSWRLRTGDPVGELLLNVFGAFGQFELAQIKERARSAREAAKASGRRVGRAPRLTDIEKQGALTMLEEGESVRQVAEAWKCSRNTIQRLKRGHR